MKNLFLKTLEKAARGAVKSTAADGTGLPCLGWTYEPKAPANVKEFLKDK